MAKIVIIGAGLTGLSTAYHLEKKGFFDYKIFEKENEIGGLCKSIYQDGFTFDYTGHLIHINDEYFNDFIENTISKNNLNSINRRSFVYSNGVYTHYPFQINLYGLDKDVIVECIEGFLNKPKNKKSPKSFYQWVINNFGCGFAKYFFLPFQTKIFDYDIKKVSAEWTGRFVPQTSLKQIIAGALQEPLLSKVGYNSQFFYPKNDGIFSWIKNIANKLQNTINLNFCVKSIDLQNKVIIFENGHAEKFDKIVTTMPLDNLLELIKEKSSSFLKRASKKLLCNAVVNFNLGLNKQILSNKHWIYFPENKFPFYRIGFPYNFSNNSVPKNCTSLYGEFSHINKNYEEVTKKLKNSLKLTKKLFNIEDNEVITEQVIYIKNAYVIYNFWRQKNLPQLLNSLKNQSIYSIGRYGEWKYSSMQEAILDGKKIINEILLDSMMIIPAKKCEDKPTNVSKNQQQELAE